MKHNKKGNFNALLARWLLAQDKADKTIILDADGTWEPYPTIKIQKTKKGNFNALLKGLTNLTNLIMAIISLILLVSDTTYLDDISPNKDQVYQEDKQV